MISLVPSIEKIFKFVEYSLKTLGNHHGNFTSQLRVQNSFSLLENGHLQVLKMYLLWCGWLAWLLAKTSLGMCVRTDWASWTPTKRKWPCLAGQAAAQLQGGEREHMQILGRRILTTEGWGKSPKSWYYFRSVFKTLAVPWSLVYSSTLSTECILLIIYTGIKRFLSNKLSQLGLQRCYKKQFRVLGKHMKRIFYLLCCAAWRNRGLLIERSLVCPELRENE